MMRKKININIAIYIKNTMSNIIKYSLNDPNADIMIIENGYINNNVISINEDMKNKVFLPTMYQSWTLPQKSHITFNNFISHN